MKLLEISIQLIPFAIAVWFLMDSVQHRSLCRILQKHVDELKTELAESDELPAAGDCIDWGQYDCIASWSDTNPLPSGDVILERFELHRPKEKT